MLWMIALLASDSEFLSSEDMMGSSSDEHEQPEGQ